ncbi:MAG: MBOAT family protein [Lachnospiraceae bacterium]|nr:MBOAT family protein [Lachnospiraceae bacterium]
MVFSSVYFVFLFLPIVFLLYYLTRGRVRNVILLCSSLLFYAYGEPVFVFVLMASVCINFLLALGIAKKRHQRLLLLVAVVLNIGLLFVYKYLYFTISLCNLIPGISLPGKEIALPIGISFFTFQALSYVIDVYRSGRAQKNLFDLALYICFFPQLIAGPIVRYHDIATQLEDPERLGRRLFGKDPKTIEDLGIGAERFLVGFLKKVLIANQLAVIADQIFDLENYAALSTPAAWIGSILFTLQIYYDFSGYSDMAIGLGRMFGFQFLENFDHPYIAGSVTEFWRRWHMSLSGWFRDYVYIPLGGNRRGTARSILNLFVVWLLTGIWHGANLTFVCWGLLYFVFLVLEKYVIRPGRFQNGIAKGIYRVITLAIVNCLWVLFRADTLEKGMTFLSRMLGITGAEQMGFSGGWYLMLVREYGIFIALALLLCMPLRKKLLAFCEKSPKSAAARVLTALYFAALPLLFFWAVSFLVLGAHNPFLYFQF